MKRKVIQIADSTLLVSMPKKWADANNIKKGDEITVEPDGGVLTITVDNKPVVLRSEINLSDYGVMAERVIHALYKKGVDELRINFEKAADFRLVQSSLTEETIGFEIIDQGPKHCVVRNVSGVPEEFDAMLRRIFLLLINMSSEGLEALKAGSLDHLNNAQHLEQTNNRLTMVCRRLANKYGKIPYPKLGIKDPKIGPLYYIVESLENLADEYKYMYQHIASSWNNSITFSKDITSVFGQVTDMLRLFYELFYKYDNKKIADIGTTRKNIIEKSRTIMLTTKSKHEMMMAHHVLVITQKIFNLTGPYLVLAT